MSGRARSLWEELQEIAGLRSSQMGGGSSRHASRGGEARSAPLQSGRRLWQNERAFRSHFAEGATRNLALIAVLSVLGLGPAAAQEGPDFEAARLQMVRVIQVEALLTGEVTGIQEIDQRVLAAMRRVPRHEFVPAPLARYAYEDTPLPIEIDQNLAQPFIT